MRSKNGMNPKVKLDVDASITWFVGIILLEGYYWALISAVLMPMHFRVIIWVIFALLPVIFNKGIICINEEVLPWILYGGMVLIRNQEFANGSFVETIRIVCCLVLTIIVASKTKWINKIPIMYILIGIPNVIATIIFYFNNKLYITFISLTYHYFQSGTGNGVNGYKAALSDNYSQNGTYIAVVLIVIGACVISGNLKNKRMKRFYQILFIATAFALLLTSKRAHLLFGIATLIVTYYLVNKSKIVSGTMRLLFIVVAVCIAYSVAIEYVPALQSTFIRFQDVGTDVASTTRFILWDNAWASFRTHPIFGIGWYGFRYQSSLRGNALAASSSGVHNIYLELLCECGLVGFFLFLFVAGRSIYTSAVNLVRSSEIEEKMYLAVSFAIQFFTLLYGLTGNAIYDKTFNLYIVAVAMNVSITIQKTKKEKLYLSKTNYRNV